MQRCKAGRCKHCTWNRGYKKIVNQYGFTEARLVCGFWGVLTWAEQRDLNEQCIFQKAERRAAA